MATGKSERTKKKSRRVRVRDPQAVAAFCKRFAEMIDELPITQRKLAGKVGGAPIDLLSRIYTGKATTLSIDFLVHLGDWAARNGVSLPWLFAGHGTMFQGGKSGLGLEWLAAASRDELIAELSRLVVDAEHVRAFLRANGDPAACQALVELLGIGPLAARAEAAAESPPGGPVLVPGYQTVGPEDVPTAPKWYKHYVPILGRIAAGEGIDTVEASEYPPAWAGEFLVYAGAPAGAVAVRLSGDSMAPTYNDGDIVVVDTQGRAEAGICCVIVDDGERRALLKRLTERGGLPVLESLNAAYPPEPIGPDQLAAAYPVVDHLPRRVPGGAP